MESNEVADLILWQPDLTIDVMALKLENKRIRLRHLRKSDADKIFQYVKDPDIANNTLLPRPYKRIHACDFITRMTRARRRSKPKDIVFVIELLKTKTLIGMVGIHRIDRVHNNAVIGYWLGKPFRGIGIVPEAVRLSLKYCFHELKLMRIYAAVFTTNKASQKVLTKCGFTLEGTLRKSHFRRGRYHDSFLYSILRSDMRNDSSARQLKQTR